MRDLGPIPINVSVHHEVQAIAKAIEQGGTNPHIVLRALLAQVYRDGYACGYRDNLSDRPIDEAPSLDDAITILHERGEHAAADVVRALAGYEPLADRPLAGGAGC